MKRIKIFLTFNFQNEMNIPLKHSISSFIYKYLMSEELSLKIHNLPSKSIRPICFSSIMFNSKYYCGQNKIKLFNNEKGDKAYFIVSSSDETIIDDIVNKLEYYIKHPSFFKIDEMSFFITGYTFDECHLDGDTFKIKTIEPICLSFNLNPNGSGKSKSKYVTYDEDPDKFNELLINNIYRKTGIYLNPSDIKVENYKRKCMAYRKNKEIIHSKLATHCIMTIKCDKEVMHKLYYSGIGMLNSGGFGLFEIV